jgi:hypothetical protein
MAYLQSSRFDRSVRYVLKKIRVTAAGLKPEKLLGHFAGPKVLSNSIPKAGTHLLEGLLEELPLLRNAGRRTLVENGAVRGSNRVLSELRKIRRGAFYNAHLPARPQYLSCLAQTGVRVILLVRDPRDIAVSRYKYAAYIDMLHRAHPYFEAAKDDVERLRMAIIGVPDAMPPLARVFEEFSGWAGMDNVLTVRFEDLRGEAGGGDSESQRQVVSGIIKHLGLCERVTDIDVLIGKAFSKMSSTFRRGQIGGWTEEFDDGALALLREQFGNTAAAFGYDLSGK